MVDGACGMLAPAATPAIEEGEMTSTRNRVTDAEKRQLWTQIHHATEDARAGHRHMVSVDHDLLRRLLRRLAELEGETTYRAQVGV